MLSISQKKRPGRPLVKPSTGLLKRGSNGSTGSTARGIQGVQTVQSLLAVARICRDCGMRLTPLEDALHQCPAVFQWTLPAETVGSAFSSEGPCRLVRLGASCRCGAADERLVELWENIRKTQMSHILELPSAEQLASKRALLLLALRGKDVLALLSAEQVSAQFAQLGPASPWSSKKEAPRGAQVAQVAQVDVQKDGDAEVARPWPTEQGSSPVRTPSPRPRRRAQPLLGVALLWTRRRERRRGLATALVDCAQQMLAPEGRVAFSQPTDLGRAFAQGYTQRIQGLAADGVLVYQPEC